MFLVTPYPNVAYALDLTKPGAPIKWKYEPHPSPMAIGKACCDAVNRGPTYADGRLVFTLLDGEAVGLDAETGKRSEENTSELQSLMRNSDASFCLKNKRN